MKKTPQYTYLGTNGTITSFVHLPDIYSIKKFELQADQYKKITKDGIDLKDIVIVPEEEVNLWYEVDI